VPKYVSSIRTVVHTTSVSSISTDLGIHIIYTYTHSYIYIYIYIHSNISYINK